MLHRSTGIGIAGKCWRAAATSRPPPSALADACDKLERGLGPFGFQWLCACAVYPGLRFPLTVHLGRCLAEFVNRPLPDENEHLALFRLPWFRTGWIPEDLRLELLQRLQPDMQPVVREAIEQVLWNAQEGRDSGSAPGLAFLRPPANWRGRLRAWLKSAANAEPARDAIFVHYMLGRVLKPTDLRLNRALVRLFGAHVAGYLDRRTLVWLVAALFAGVTLWSFAQVAVEPLFTTIKVVSGFNGAALTSHILLTAYHMPTQTM